MEDKPGQEGTAACEEDALESFATANSDLQEEVTDPGLVRQRAREAVSQLCLDINSFPGMEVRVFLTSSDCEAIDGNPVVELNGTYFPIEGGLGETVIQETLPVGQLDPLGPLDVRFCNDAEQG